MKRLSKKGAIAAAVAASALVASQVPGRADDTAAEIRALKARLKQLEAKVAEQERKQKQAQANVRNAAAPPCKEAACPPPPPPVFVSFKNGLYVETLDKAFSFKVGGRIMVDGGVSTQPFLGRSGAVGIPQARFVAEGKAFKYWMYKLQYDFGGSNVATTAGGSTTSPIGGVRDAYLALAHPALTTPVSPDPVVLQVGNFYTPFGVERTTTRQATAFIERALPSDAFGASRHIGAAAFLRGPGPGMGEAQWTVKGGVFSTSLEDKALGPSPGIPVTAWALPGGGALYPKAGNWVATGGGQYFDLIGRATYALVKTEDNLLHIGGSLRYHRPNDATALNDDRVLAPGANLKSEAGSVINENLLGTPDLSCGLAPSFNGIAGTSAVAGKCVRDVVAYGAELSAVYGPFSVQAEYMGAHYDRDPLDLAYARNARVFSAAATKAPFFKPAGIFAPGGASLDFDGYYVYATLFLTGESRAASYKTDYTAPGTFGPVKIKHPVSAGGWGAWEVGVRYSMVALNDSPIGQPTYAALAAALANPALYTKAGACKFGGFCAAAYNLATSGVLGGREENLTVGLNWYPDPGIRVMANWVRVMSLAAPFDRPYLNGAHPNFFLVRTQVDW